MVEVHLVDNADGDGARIMAEGLLVEARAALNARERTHGHVRSNLERTAELWVCLLGSAADLGASDVALALCMLKLARIREGDPLARDHWVDALGYLALAGGLVLEAEESLA